MYVRSWFFPVFGWVRLWSSMMTSSNGNIFTFTGHLCGEFTGPGEFPVQRPVTWSFDVFLDLRPNKRLSKQWWGWWFETLLRPLWRHCNGLAMSFGFTPLLLGQSYGCLSASEAARKICRQANHINLPVTGNIIPIKQRRREPRVYSVLCPVYYLFPLMSATSVLSFFG